MAETEIKFTGDDMTEIATLLADMAFTQYERSGERGLGLTRMIWKLADDIAGRWLALDDGRDLEAVKVVPNALTEDAADVLEDARQRLAGMELYRQEKDPVDEPWAFVLGLLRRQVDAELEARSGEMN